jgi:hypothetical protein
MKSVELERDAMKCLLLAQEVPDPRQRQILEEFGVALLHVAGLSSFASRRHSSM